MGINAEFLKEFNGSTTQETTQETTTKTTTKTTMKKYPRGRFLPRGVVSQT